MVNDWEKIQCSCSPRGSYIFAGKEVLNCSLSMESPSGEWEGKESNLQILSYWITLILAVALRAK